MRRKSYLAAGVAVVAFLLSVGAGWWVMEDGSSGIGSSPAMADAAERHAHESSLYLLRWQENTYAVRYELRVTDVHGKIIFYCSTFFLIAPLF